MGPPTIEVVFGTVLEGPNGEPLPEPVTIVVKDRRGNPWPDAEVSLAVSAGGGSITPERTVTNGRGRAGFSWTLGLVPVANRVRAESDGATLDITARPVMENPLEADLVAEVPAGITAEDLAFRHGQGLYLGNLGGIYRMPAPGTPAEPLEISGIGVCRPAGIAFDGAGNLYEADLEPERGAVVKVDPGGEASLFCAGYEGLPFALSNDIAFGPGGDLFLSDTCGDRIYRIDDAGEASIFVEVTGPNGLAFNGDSTALYVTTENPFFFCPPSPSFDGGLYRVPLGEDGEPGALEALLPEVALTGDGLAFDIEGNLYIVFTGLHPMTGDPADLRRSSLFVLPASGDPIAEILTFTMPRDLMTNIAFGVEPFDTESIYIYGFTGKLYRVRIGIPGRALP